MVTSTYIKWASSSIVQVVVWSVINYNCRLSSMFVPWKKNLLNSLCCRMIYAYSAYATLYVVFKKWSGFKVFLSCLEYFPSKFFVIIHLCRFFRNLLDFFMVYSVILFFLCEILMIKNILIGRKESDTYLITVSRHRWSS